MSEELDCLDKIVDKGRINAGSCCHWRECLSKNKCILHNNDLMCDDYTRANAIKQALIKSEENERVLKIVFEKPARSGVVIVYIKTTLNPTYEDYCSIVKEEYQLTQEEFDLLKKVSCGTGNTEGVR